MDLQYSDDLGLRKPKAWVSMAGPLIEREEIKNKRRADLMSGTAANLPLSNRPQGQAHLTLRRRDEHARIPPKERASKHVRQACILQQLKLKREPKDSSLHYTLPPEDDTGCIEYKLKVSFPHPIRLQQLITQMQFRLTEGEGEAFYYLGVVDDGYPKGLDSVNLEASIATLTAMAIQLRATATLVRCFPGAHGRRCALVHIQRGSQEVCYTDMRVAVAGCVDSGKSTLVAVLTQGRNGDPSLDSGRGSARMAVLKHKHELESGRTSSLSQQLLGYDEEGNVLNYRGVSGQRDVCKEAAKVLTFIDMGGHERCLKTALYGLTAMLPDFVLLCVSAVGQGLGRVSREHLAVAVALGVPVAVVVTKVDMATPDQLAAVVEDVRALAGAALPSLSTTENPGAHHGGDGGAGGAPSAGVDTSTVCPVVQSEQHAKEVARIAACVQRAGQEQPYEKPAASEQYGWQEKGGESAPGESGVCIQPDGQQSTAEQELVGEQGGYSCTSHLPFFAPIFPVSAVTGEGLAALHAFLRACESVSDQGRGHHAGGPNSGGSRPGMAAARPLHPTAPACDNASPSQMEHGQQGRQDCTSQQQLGLRGLHTTDGHAHTHAPTHFQVDRVYSVESVGHVVSGTVVSGVVRVGMQLMVGPGVDGSFTAVAVTGIQRAFTPVRQVRAGQAATLALQPVCEAGDEPIPPWPPRPLLPLVPTWHTALAGSGHTGPMSATKPALAAGGMHERQIGAAGRGRRGSAASVSASASSAQMLPELSTDCPSGMSELDDMSDLGLGALDLLGCSDGESEPLRRRCASAAVELSSAAVPAAMAPAHSQIVTPAASVPISASASFMALPASNERDEVSSDVLALFSMDDDPSVDESQSSAGTAGDRFTGLLDGSWATEASSRDLSTRAHSTRARSQTASSTAAATGATAAAAGAPVHGHAGVPSQGMHVQHLALPPHYPQHIDATGTGYSTSTHASSLSAPATTTLGTSPPTSLLLDGTPPSTRKGAVLLGGGLQPRACRGFQCVLVLLGGQWPARGLVSGKWPPIAEDDKEGQRTAAADLAAPVHSSGCASPQRSMQRVRSRAKLSDFTAVIHCGNIRQLARLEELQELPEALTFYQTGKSDGCTPVGSVQQLLRFPSSLRAAAALLHVPSTAGASAEAGSVAEASEAFGGDRGAEGLEADCGCMVLATFRFSFRPEWLQPGARLIVRDRNSGHVSGAGCVQHVVHVSQ